MNINNLDHKTTEQLHSELTSLRSTTVVLAVVLFLLFSFAIYNLMTNIDNTSALTSIAIVFALGSMIPMDLKKMKSIRKQLKLRDAQLCNKLKQ